VPPASSTPLLSVVVPTRDRADRLEGAVASVLRQTYPTLDVVIVDDGSRDATAEVTAKLAALDGRVRVVRLTTAGGAAAARNRGMDEARGELVAFLDDDDRWLPDKTARQVQHLLANPDVALVSCRYEEAVEGASTHPVTRLWPRRCSADDLLWFNFAGNTSCCMLGRAAVDDGIRFDESFPSFQDWDLWVRCARVGGVEILPDVLCRFTVHAGPRISLPARQQQGWERFLAKHGDAMSPSCLAYHRAHLEMFTDAGQGRRTEIARRLARTAPAATVALVSAEWLVTHAGRLVGQPGLNAAALGWWLRRAG